MKLVFVVVLLFGHKSRPARGGWIEMSLAGFYSVCLYGPAPHGAGGLKCDLCDEMYIVNKVPPRTGRVD